MKLKYFEYAAAVAKARSINKAAEELMLSQPYLSSCLKYLEKEVGFPIFLRNYNGVTLTTKGMAFMEHAQRIIKEMNQITELGNRVEDKPLDIASFSLSFVMKAFLDFKRCSPIQSQDRLTEYPYEKVYEAVAKEANRIGIVLSTYTDAEKQKLYQRYGLYGKELVPATPYCIVAGPDHPFYGKEEVTTDEMCAHPMVFYDTPMIKEYISWLEMPRLPEYSLAVTDRGAYFDAVASGNFYAVMTHMGDSGKTALQYIPMTHVHAAASLELIYLKNYRLNNREKEFVDYLKGRL